MPTERIEVIEAYLRKIIASSDLDYLPSIRTLRSELKTGKEILNKVLDKLACEGLLSISPRVRIRINRAGNKEPQIPDHFHLDSSLPAVEKAYRHLRKRIESGEWRHSDSLPKLAMLCRDAGASTFTIRIALRRLIKEGAIVKHGRRWVVGAAPSRQNFVLTKPVVHVIMPRMTFWKALSMSDRYAPLVRTFAEEAERRNLVLLPVVLSETSDSKVSIYDEVIERCRDLNERYFGSLLLGSTHEIPDMPRWVAGLCAFRRPVVWIDRYNEKSFLKGNPGFIRCHYSESSGVSAALESLSSAGHRQIGYLSSIVESEWSRTRLQRIVATGREQFPQIQIHALRDQEWNTEVLSGALDNMFRAIYFSNSPVRAQFDTFASNWPEYSGPDRECLAQLLDPIPETDRFARLMAILRYYSVHTENRLPIGPEVFLTPRICTLLRKHPGITAILAANDNTAISFYSWCKAASVAIPRDLSILSFDNYEGTRVWPISSIDFGFGTLGYHAAHALLNDIPLPKDRRGNIPSQARLADRGSIGSPRPVPLYFTQT